MTEVKIISLALSLSVHCGHFDKFEFKFYDGNRKQNHFDKIIAYRHINENEVININRYFKPTSCSIVGTMAYFTGYNGDKIKATDRAIKAEKCCEGIK